MALQLGKLARVQSQNPAMESIPVWGNNGKLITDVHEKLLSFDDFVSLTNIRYELGKPRTREALYKLTGAALAAGKFPKTIAIIPISTTNHLLVVSDDFKLYSITGAEGSMAFNAAIATLDSSCVIIPFSGYAVLCDTGYLKYYNGTAVKIMYDDGTGSGGYYSNKLTGSVDGSKGLYVTSSHFAGNIITTPNTGYAWPVTQITAWLKKVGTPTGGSTAVTARIYKVSDNSLIATSTTSYDPATFSTNAAVFDFDFASGTELLNYTPYRFGIFYNDAGSTSTDCVKIEYTSVASGGLSSFFDGTSWTTNGARDLMIGVKPGLPPKAGFGCVAHNRLHVVDPDAPGRLKICAPGDGFDWSTPTLAGSVNSIDDSANSFPIGAVVEKYGDIWIFGKAKQAYLAKLVGSSPADWVIKLSGQEAHTSHLSIQDTVDDLYFASSFNCNNMAGTEQYGDIRAGGVGNPVKNLFETYWTTVDAFSGYWGRTGQYFIYLPTYGTMVCHTKDGSKRWTRYTYKNLTESAYFGADTNFYVGCTDGNLYRLSSSLFSDAGVAYDVTMEGGIGEFPFGEMQLVKIYHRIFTTGTTTAKLHLYRNGSGTAMRDINIAAGEGIQGSNCIMNAKSIKIKLDTVAFTATTYFDSIIIRARRLYGIGQR
jgi:hypothetical protein